MRTRSLQDRFRCGVSFLQIDAPIAKLFQRNRYAGYGAANERAWPHYTEVAVEIFDLGLAGHRRGTIRTIKHYHLRACGPGAGLPLWGRCGKPKHNNAGAATKGKLRPRPDHQFVILTALRGHGAT
jgi:hypothetical protein